MNEFSNTDIYGFDLLDDPALRTTAQNFEFKYVTRERIERLVRNVQHDRLQKRGTSIWREFCKENYQPPLLSYGRGSGNSTDIPQIPSIQTSNESATKIRVLNDDEIETLISKSVNSPTKSGRKQKIRFSHDKSVPSTAETSPDNSARIMKGILVNRHTARMESARSLVKNEVREESPPDTGVSRKSMDTPKWRKSTPTSNTQRLIPFDPLPDSDSDKEDNDSEVEIDLVSSGHPSTVNLQTLDEPVEGRTTCRSDYINTYTLVIESDNETDRSPDRELNESNVDMKSSRISGGEEAQYRLQLREATPTDVPAGKVKANPSLTGRERLELQRIVGLKPPSPELNLIQDEDQPSVDDFDDDYQESDKEDYDMEGSPTNSASSSIVPVVHIRQQSTTDLPKADEQHSPKTLELERPLTEADVPKYVKKDIKAILTHRKTAEPAAPTARSARKEPDQSSAWKMDKQLDGLKSEKMAIFSKITSFQEKIIEMIDKLRMSLLELSLPDGNIERKRREKNVIEFTARFARNYLYPVERMIEELRVTPKEDFVSIVSNDPCSKVCGLYGFLTQALQSYHKQIRYLLLDQSPRRLDALINFVQTATNLCLRKKIFDKKDTVIQSIQERCQSFLVFMNEIHEHRKSAIQESYVKPKKPTHSGNISKASSKWNLTMQLNNLNMYEPKVVAKKDIKRRQVQSKTSITKQKSTSSVKMLPSAKPTQRNPSKRNSRMNVIKKDFVGIKENSTRDSIKVLNTDAVNTQVETIGNAESMCFGNSSIHLQSAVNIQQSGTLNQPKADSNVDLNKTVIEALLSITKDEVRHILGPLMNNFGTLFNGTTTNNPQMVESLLTKLSVDLSNDLQQQRTDVVGSDSSTVHRSVCMPSTKDDNQLQPTVPTASKKAFAANRLCAGIGGRKPMTTMTSSSSSSAMIPSTPALIPQSRATLASPTSAMSIELLDEGDNNADDVTREFDRPRKASIAQVLGERKLRYAMNRKKGMVEVGANCAINNSREGSNVQKLNYDNNIQYTFVRSNQALTTPEKETMSTAINPKPEVGHTRNKDTSNTGRHGETQPRKLSNSIRKSYGSEVEKDDLGGIFRDRSTFIHGIAENPLYVNESFPEPWKLLTKMTNKLSKEILESEADINVSLGEEKYLKDFLRMELNMGNM